MKNLLIILISLIPVFTTAQNLTGYWISDQRTCYEIRQEGQHVYWYSKNVSKNSPINVFKGEISGNELKGKWCDMPSYTKSNCHETIALEIKGKNKMVKTYNSTVFGGKEWTRLDGPCENGNTVNDSSGDLLGCFKKHPEQALKGFNKPRKVSSLKECASECLNNDWCWSFDYEERTKKCYLSEKSKENATLRPYEGWDYYHNMCWKGEGDNPNGNNGNTGGSTSSCFKAYPKKMLKGNSPYRSLYVNLEECKSTCLDDPDCKSFEYYYPTEKCFLRKVSISEGYSLKDYKTRDHFDNLCR